MKFIAYYRVSTDKQGESGLGLEAQQQICYAYARSEGAEIVALAVQHSHRRRRGVQVLRLQGQGLTDTKPGTVQNGD